MLQAFPSQHMNTIKQAIETQVHQAKDAQTHTREDRTILYEVEEIQQDATVCRYLFTAKLLHLFQASIVPIIRSTQNCSCSLWYRSHYLGSKLPQT